MSNENTAAPGGFLGTVERIGNKLPDPAMLFVGLLAIVWILSWLLSYVSFDVVDPRSGETLVINNLLAGAAMTEFLSVMVTNFSHFHPVGVVLVAMLGIGVAEHTGFINAGLRALLNVTPQKLLTPMVVAVGIVSHTAADAGYVLVIPLGGVIFYAAGRHPLAGIAAAFAGVSGGFSASFIPSSIDPLLQGLTQAGAQILDPEVVLNPLNNYFFTTASSILIISVGWFITDRIVEPRLQNEEIDGDKDDLPEMHALEDQQRKGLRWAGISMLLGIVVLVATAWPGDSPWRDATGDIASFTAPMMRSIVSLIFLLFLIPGVVYGIVAGTVKGSKDIIVGMTKSMNSMAYYLVIMFFIAQFVYAFGQSNLGVLLALQGAAFLQAMAMPAAVTIVGIVILTAFVNIFVGSASGKWGLLAPIFVPMLMSLGISPDLTQAAYHNSETTRQREQASVLSNGRFNVAADYYYNPLGPIGSPNRIPGLDGIIPDEGLGFELREFRPVTFGPRQTTVKSDSYRFLIGATGYWGEWNWDTGVVYSEANTEDSTTNRLLTSELQFALTNQPTAFNIFSSVNPNDPTSGIDASPVNPSDFQSMLTTVVRDVTTTLTLVDLKLSQPALFSLPGGEAALGFGIEYRQEELDEDNSSNLDGSNPFIDPLDTGLMPGEITNASNVQGSSVRPDVFADRSVFSAYAELILPLIADKPGIRNLDAQLAIRYEDFDDVGSISRPKAALAWSPSDWLQIRAAYSEGFRAPNLIQLNSPGTAITVGVDDYAAGLALGTGTIDDGPSNGNYNLITGGNADLVPEESENVSFGIVLTPIDELTFTADWWEVEATGTVGVLNDENISRLDAIARANGSFNPAVVRDPTTIDPLDNPFGTIIEISRAYENLNTRTVSGFDLGLKYDMETSIGGFSFDLNGARTLSYDQEAGGDALTIVNFGANPTVLGAAVGSLIEREFIPKWRVTGAARWNSNNELWAARLFANYVGEVFEPTITGPNPSSGDTEFFVVDDSVRVNTSVTRYDAFSEGLRITLGINNIFDEDPPIADESFGYEGELGSSRGRYLYVSARYSF